MRCSSIIYNPIWKIYNIWCTCFPVQTLVQLPCGEILAFSYQCLCEKCRRAPCGSVEVKGGGMGRHQEASVCGHLGLSSQVEVSLGFGEESALFSADHGGSFQTWRHPSHSGEDTHLSSLPRPHWPVSVTKTFDSTCILDSRSGQRERKYLEEKEFSPRYVCSLPQSLGVSAFLLLWHAHLHQTSLIC